MRNWRKRISIDPGVCHGQAVIRGTRILVWVIVSMFARERSIADVLEAYPQLEKEDVLAALEYAAELAQGKIVQIGSQR
jgi:uncharacterized protein (DUF433 family)